MENNRFFYSALFISLAIHLIVLGILSHKKKLIQDKPAKQMEITYKSIEPKKVVKISKKEPQKVSVEQKDELLKKADLVEKEFKNYDPFKETVDKISTNKAQVDFNKSKIPLVKSLSMDRRVTIPMFKSEKITDLVSVRYNNYKDRIRDKIFKQAYLYVDDPDFETGSVTLSFVIYSTGKLKEVFIVEDKSHNVKFVRRTGLKILKSISFDEFPPEWKNLPEVPFSIEISFELKND